MCPGLWQDLRQVCLHSPFHISPQPWVARPIVNLLVPVRSWSLAQGHPVGLRQPWNPRPSSPPHATLLPLPARPPQASAPTFIHESCIDVIGGSGVLLGRASGMRGGGGGPWEFATVAWPAASLLPFPGLSPQQRCPRGSSDCKKQGPRDHYLAGDGRCTACVSCHGKSPWGTGRESRRWGWGASGCGGYTLNCPPHHVPQFPAPDLPTDISHDLLHPHFLERLNLVNWLPQGRHSQLLSLVFAKPTGEDSCLIPALQ